MPTDSNDTSESRWLTPWRLNVYPRAMFVAMVLAFVGLLLLSEDLITPAGVPLGGDYPVFYGVSSLMIDGEFDAVFDVAAVNQSQADALGKPGLDKFHAWVYPPYVALLIAPLSLVGYVPSFILFTLLMTLAIWQGVTWLGRLSPWIAENRLTIFAAVASFYPLLRAATGGQNTPLTFMLLCGSLAMLVQGRQWAAGILLGLLMAKPHFALPFIVLALFARQWKTTLASASVTAVYYVAGAVFFGWDWPLAWLDVLANYRELEGNVNGRSLVSLLGVSEQLFGTGQPLALAVGIGSSLGLFTFLCIRFSKVAGPAQLSSMWGVATVGVILTSPHSQFYEVGLLALPAVLLADRFRMTTAGPLIALWSICWIHSFGEPLIQPLFFVTVAMFFYSLKLPAADDPA